MTMSFMSLPLDGARREVNSALPDAPVDDSGRSPRATPLARRGAAEIIRGAARAGLLLANRVEGRRPATQY